MISREEIKKLANLSRIDINDSEVDGYTKSIGDILNYVDAVKKVANEQNVEAVYVTKNVLRDDVVLDSNLAKDIMKNVSKVSNGFVEVKKILKGK